MLFDLSLTVPHLEVCGERKEGGRGEMLCVRIRVEG